jgi:hypothetical protein
LYAAVRPATPAPITIIFLLITTLGLNLKINIRSVLMSIASSSDTNVRVFFFTQNTTVHVEIPA